MENVGKSISGTFLWVKTVQVVQQQWRALREFETTHVFNITVKI